MSCMPARWGVVWTGSGSGCWFVELIAAGGALLLCFCTLGLFFIISSFERPCLASPFFILTANKFYFCCDFVFVFVCFNCNEMTFWLISFSWALTCLGWNIIPIRTRWQCSQVKEGAQKSEWSIKEWKKKKPKKYLIPYKLVCAGCNVCDGKSLLYLQDCMSAFCQ